ncbi:MAG: hypothetical protein ACK4V6_15785 [Microthrixaceae bacterium]
MKRSLSMVLAAAALAFGIWCVPGQAGATNIGNEGCTPGYWKNHTESWEEFTPSSPLNVYASNFTFPDELAKYRTVTFLEALNFGGGRGVEGGAQILLRAATAAYLNAAHEGLGYPYRRYQEPFNIQAQVNAALASLDRGTMIELAGVLDQANNLGCPLN